jgi:DNA invertase Pin-like site-specific DNA recombinase
MPTANRLTVGIMAMVAEEERRMISKRTKEALQAAKRRGVKLGGAYLRVSTQRQGKSGLGLEAQHNAVTEFLNGGNWSLVKECVEVESGKRSDRPELAKAIQACRAYGAKLVIAKLDRLAMPISFSVWRRPADFVAADMPTANRLTVGIMAMVAEEERRMISKRTKEALQAAKRRGVKLGGDRGVIPTRTTRKLAVMPYKHAPRPRLLISRRSSPSYVRPAQAAAVLLR